MGIAEQRVGNTLGHVHVKSQSGPPFETAVCPLLTPLGRGAFRWRPKGDPLAVDLSAYLEFRTKQWCTQFTMHSAWLLLACQLKSKAAMATSPMSVRLTCAAAKADALNFMDVRKVLHALPPGMPGTPRFWNRHLDEALAVVQAYGKVGLGRLLGTVWAVLSMP